MPEQPRYYPVPPDVELAPGPRQQDGIPLWIGSWGSRAGLARVARAGDGWLASAYNTTPERLLRRPHGLGARARGPRAGTGRLSQRARDDVDLGVGGSSGGRSRARRSPGSSPEARSRRASHAGLRRSRRALRGAPLALRRGRLRARLPVAAGRRGAAARTDRCGGSGANRNSDLLRRRSAARALVRSIAVNTSRASTSPGRPLTPIAPPAAVLEHGDAAEEEGEEGIELARSTGSARAFSASSASTSRRCAAVCLAPRVQPRVRRRAVHRRRGVQLTVRIRDEYETGPEAFATTSSTIVQALGQVHVADLRQRNLHLRRVGRAPGHSFSPA